VLCSSDAVCKTVNVDSGWDACSRHCVMHLIAINESQLQVLNHAPGIRPVTSCLDLEDRLESCMLSITQGFLTIAGVPW